MLKQILALLFLLHLTTSIAHPRSLRNVLEFGARFKNSLSQVSSLDADGQSGLNLKCLACEVSITLIQWLLLEAGASFDEVAVMFDYACRQMNIEPGDVCDGIVNGYKDEVMTALSNTTLTSREICTFVVGDDCMPMDDPRLMWNVSLPNIPKPPVVPPSPPSKKAPKLRVLHLSDIHVDFDYKPGSNADCGRPLCCQDNQSYTGRFSPAGKWGDYRSCDVPTWTIENLFRFLLKQAPFDYILWTGDQSSHRVWNITRAEQLKTLDYITNLFLKYFPDVPVFPALGNHEGVPANSFPLPSITGDQSSRWLYESLIKSWKHWLPSSTAGSLLRGGFYTVLVKPGFRVVSMNMNYCNSGNWWLLINMTDPASELQWLIDILQNAELHGEKVQIIGHIPPGRPECLKAWSWNYYRIIDRYEGVIAAQFFGHTHWDSWEMFYDADSGFKRPLSVGFIGPSVTPFYQLNPGYRIYEMDGFYPNSSWMVLDHETFIMNLTAANMFDKPVWFSEYSAKKAYNMTSAVPTEWDATLRKLWTDDAMFEKFYRFYLKSHDQNGCDKLCRKRLLCDIRSGRSHDPKLCAEVFSDGQPDQLLAEDLDKMYTQYLSWSRNNSRC